MIVIVPNRVSRHRDIGRSTTNVWVYRTEARARGETDDDHRVVGRDVDAVTTRRRARRRGRRGRWTPRQDLGAPLERGGTTSTHRDGRHGGGRWSATRPARAGEGGGASPESNAMARTTGTVGASASGVVEGRARGEGDGRARGDDAETTRMQRRNDSDENLFVRDDVLREEGVMRERETIRIVREWTRENAPGERSGLTSVWRYCALELGFRVGEREDDPDMSHARERVFDLLWYIPLELEKFCLYGGLLCADAILGLFTSLPVRVLSQTVRLVWSAATLTRNDNASSKRRAWGIHPYAREHLNDVLWLLMLGMAVMYTHMIDVSVIYHYIRGQEVIKLYMACHVLETFDKLLCSFNSNVLDALQNSVHGCVNSATNGSVVDQAQSALRLIVDISLSTAATVAHTFILLTYAVTLSVAINSHSNAILLVLISNNFAEMKGHVFKKQDPEKLFGVSRLDVIERVHLCVCLLFVTAQRITAAGSIEVALTRKFMNDIVLVMGSEVFVDIIKHSFMAKLNGLRPGVYRRFYRQICRDHVHLMQSYKIHQVVGFVPLAPAAVIVRAVPSLFRTLKEGAIESDTLTRGNLNKVLASFSTLMVSLGFMLILVCFKLMFGIAIHAWGVRSLSNSSKVTPSAERWGAKTPGKIEPGKGPVYVPSSPPRIKVN